MITIGHAQKEFVRALSVVFIQRGDIINMGFGLLMGLGLRLHNMLQNLPISYAFWCFPNFLPITYARFYATPQAIVVKFYSPL